MQKLQMIKRLHAAYCSDDPSAILYRQESIRTCDIMNLFSCIEDDADVQSDSPCWDTLQDRNRVREMLEQETPAPATRLGYFVYFSTALSHVWLTSERHIDVEQPILTYAGPNTPVSYVWLNLDDQGSPQVIRHNMAGIADLLLFSIHMYDGMSTLQTTDVSCDLQTGQVTPAVPRSGWATIGINTYTRRAQLKSAHRNGICFMVVLTCSQVWSGAYLHDGKTGQAHTMACVIHR
jgi:hypothetical protein